MSIGTFTLIKNEKDWILPHVLKILPYVDEMVFFDGNSTDGTLKILEGLKSTKDGSKITLVKDRDPKDLTDDYVKLFNECMWTLKTDLAWFLHPDMFVVNPEQILKLKDSSAIAAFTHLDSYAGEPGEDIYRIQSGRTDTWKNIYRLRNPSLGAHYHGHYGAANEDIYFADITGDNHDHYGSDFSKYPYVVEDSRIKVLHFSDVRTYGRRLSRMITCLINQGYPKETAEKLALTHPRVTLKNGCGFTFVKDNYPPEFIELRDKFGVTEVLA